MDDNELKKIEEESTELLALLRETRDEDNVAVRIAPCPQMRQKSLRLSPYWLVAASVLGFVLGTVMPRGDSFPAKEYTTLLADTGVAVGCSLAAGDVNFALLVK